MKLNDLLRGMEILETNVTEDTEILGVTYDSRKVQPGWLFVAVTGFVSDGNKFIPMALEKGAAAVVTARKPEGEIPYVLVPSDRLALAQLGINWFGHPAEAMTMVGITGTNGKTSSSLLCKHILENVCHAKVGLIGTMYNMVGSEVIPTERTTPESFELQALFAQMRDAGCTHVVMEVSSHAIALERVGGVHFRVGAFTNLTEDHLDFHKTMDAYCDTKALLFSRCDKAVLNLDDPWYPRIKAQTTADVLTMGLSDAAELRAEHPRLCSDRVCFTAVCGAERADVEVPIPGRFTVYNALTALGTAVSLGCSLADAAAALKTAQGVKGRVEVVPTPGKDYTILIDYAHTPDGLENVLSSVKEFCQGRLIAVFGCGGDRDPMKRPIMGRIGVELADLAIITSDNPRTEEPMAIIRDILAGIDPNSTYEVVENRPAAIHRAMDIARAGDIIVLAGKGHETYQEIHHVKYHLDEREVVAGYLTENEA